ncbi:MAG: hypothetical protein IPK83_25130 [Planctomycetes bacterium]|nr:hypothetical protein [Planctomycetota bacterium]
MIEVTATGKGGFYTELAGAFAYPIPALSSILTASGIAFLAAMLPVAVITALSNLMEQSNVGTEEGVQSADLSNLQIILMGIFAAEVFFFPRSPSTPFSMSCTTGVNDDQPPKLRLRPQPVGQKLYLLRHPDGLFWNSLIHRRDAHPRSGCHAGHRR